MKIKSLITDTLNKYGLRPKKSLGQNFLINEKIYKDIIEAAGIKRGETVLEIGPGIGTLTDYIEKAVGERGRVLAVEKDSQFVKILGDRFKKNKNVKIIN
ncbi:MAG: 16S rRNA (adenine(1518)-N(6)/adenine(1519)-N(6))-dimethyltransferase, partial [Candidatus Staskawiczbacteria bacterium]|nr:16S rRNA (adenine(1518)-N(6)/adenine(1519)-N(6))-dimethyltransferase [Candidatus Staskawiczbacteria bacterium]